MHNGHRKILKLAKKYKDVIAGLLIDKTIATYKNTPYLDCDKRKVVVKGIKYANEVIPQKTLDYVENLNLIEPDYAVHGNVWKSGFQKETKKSH